MEQNSPSTTYGPPNWATGYHSSNFKSPLTSPQGMISESPDFSPKGFSSPNSKKHQTNNRGRGGGRYSSGYNNSGSYSSPNNNYHNWRSSGNFNSPNNKHHYSNRRGNYHRYSSDSSDNCNISLYFHPSMLQDPWEELEKSSKNSSSNEVNKTQCSPTDLNNGSPVQN